MFIPRVGVAAAEGSRRRILHRQLRRDQRDAMFLAERIRQRKPHEIGVIFKHCNNFELIYVRRCSGGDGCWRLVHSTWEPESFSNGVAEMDPVELKKIYDALTPAQRYYIKNRERKKQLALERYYAKRDAILAAKRRATHNT